MSVSSVFSQTDEICESRSKEAAEQLIEHLGLLGLDASAAKESIRCSFAAVFSEGVSRGVAEAIQIKPTRRSPLDE